MIFPSQFPTVMSSERYSNGERSKRGTCHSQSAGLEAVYNDPRSYDYFCFKQQMSGIDVDSSFDWDKSIRMF